MLIRISCVAAIIAIVAPVASPQCSAAAFGSLSADPLIVSGTYSLSSGCTVDFGDREVILQSGSITGADFTLICGKLTVDSNFTMASPNQGSIALMVVPSANHDGSMTLQGLIDVRDSYFGGDVIIDCGAFYTQSGGGRIRAQGTTATADGGPVSITANGPVTTYVEVFIIDLNAPNGHFHQPEMVTVTYTN